MIGGIRLNAENKALKTQGPPQARIAAAVIFFTVGFVALLIGALLAWRISEPVSRLSALGETAGRGDGGCWGEHLGFFQDKPQTKHLYTYTYIHLYIHTYMHTYVHAYIRTCIHTYMHTYVHAYIHTYMHTYVHAYIHACIHTYICIYMCVCTSYIHHMTSYDISRELTWRGLAESLQGVYRSFGEMFRKRVGDVTAGWLFWTTQFWSLSEVFTLLFSIKGELTMSC